MIIILIVTDLTARVHRLILSLCQALFKAPCASFLGESGLLTVRGGFCGYSSWASAVSQQCALK